MASNDRSTRRSSAALVGALALHGAVLLATFSAHDRSIPDAAPTGSTSPTIEVEVRDDAVVDPVIEPSTRVEPSHAGTVAHGREQAAAGSRPGESPEPRGGAPGEPSGDYALDPSAPPGHGERPEVDLGIAAGDWSRWTKPGAPRAETGAPYRPPAPVSTTGGLAEALEAHDQGVGLGPAGAVLSAAREAAHSDVAPALGRATFAITVLRTGSVAVQLVGASSNVDGWQKVAASMTESIRRKPPRIDPSRNGARIGIEVTAEEHWPNGAPVRTEGPSVAVTPPSLRTVDQSKDDLATRNPAAIPPPASPVEQPSLKANVDLPGVFLQGRGKVCSYKVGITPFGLGASGGCDPSNIGAPPQRVVSTRVVSESMF
jgi:hypothetical protein